LPQARTDTFGEPMNEVGHAHTLHFGNSDFASGDWIRKLSVASRTSASIPGVFEPSFIAGNESDAKKSERPNFVANASFDASRWAVDGGVTVNLPLKQALSRIFDQSSSGDVRRVALYVCPTPSDAPELANDDPAEMPTLLESLITIVTAPRAQGVSSDIDTLERENAAVDRQRSVREAIARYMSSLLMDDANIAFDVYKQRRSLSSIAEMLGRLQRASSRRLPMGESEMTAVFLGPRLALLPDSRDEITVPWRWGISPVEQAVSVAVDLIRRAYRFVNGPDDGTNTEWLRNLGEAKAAIHKEREVLTPIRNQDGAFWAARFAQFPVTTDETTLANWATKSYEEWPYVDQTPAARANALLALDSAHAGIAQALATVAPTLTAIARAALRGTRITPAEEAELFLAQLAALGLHASAPSPPQIVQRQLLRLHVLQTVVVGDVQSREQRVDLMQVSWNSFNGIDNRKPQAKLAGNELGRLGAFLKPSWRANDWFWGRMDSAYKLVLLLLEPVRLRQLGQSRDAVRAALQLPNPLPEAVAKELAFLDDSSLEIPKALVETAQLVATRLQVEIAQEELPLVAAAVHESNAAHAYEGDLGEFRKKVDAAPRDPNYPQRVAAEHVPSLLAAMKIGDESIGDELGYGLMNKVATRGVAVAVNMLSSKNSGLPVSRFVRPLRAPLQALNSVVSLLAGDNPLARGAAAFLLAVAGAIVSLRAVGIDVPAGTFSISAFLLVALVVIAMARSRLLATAALLVLPTVVIFLALLGPDLRELAYSKAVTPAPIKVKSGGSFTLGEGALLQITEGTGKNAKRNDLSFAAGATLKVDAPVKVQPGPTLKDGDVGWKKWGFTNGWSVFGVLAWAAAGAAVWLTYSAFERPNSLKWFGFLLAIPVFLALATWHTRLFNWLLSQDEPAPGQGRGLKFGVVRVAEHLAEFKLEVVLLTLVGTSMALALGADLAVKRVIRKVQPRKVAA